MAIDPTHSFFSFARADGTTAMAVFHNEEDHRGGIFEIIAGGREGQFGHFDREAQTLTMLDERQRITDDIVPAANMIRSAANIHAEMDTFALSFDEPEEIESSMLYAAYFESVAPADRADDMLATQAHIASMPDFGEDEEPEHEDVFDAERMAVSRAYSNL